MSQIDTITQVVWPLCWTTWNGKPWSQEEPRISWSCSSKLYMALWTYMRTSTWHLHLHRLALVTLLNTDKFPLPMTTTNTASSLKQLVSGMGNGQKPTGTKAHLTTSHWTKAHCLNWQGGQKPTYLKTNRVKSFINLLTLIRLPLQGISHGDTCSVFSLTLLFLLYVVTNNLIWALKAIDILQFGSNNLL